MNITVLPQFSLLSFYSASVLVLSQRHNVNIAVLFALHGQCLRFHCRRFLTLILVALATMESIAISELALYVNPKILSFFNEDPI